MSDVFPAVVEETDRRTSSATTATAFPWPSLTQGTDTCTPAHAGDTLDILTACRAQRKECLSPISAGQDETQEQKERQMRLKYRQCLKSRDTKSDGLALSSVGQGGGPPSDAEVAERLEPSQRKDQAPALSSLPTSRSQINHKGGVLLERYFSHRPCPSLCLPHPSSQCCL